MNINTQNLVTMTEANQNFSKVVKKVEENGQVVILKNNKPTYVVSKFTNIVLTEDELAMVVAQRILKEHAKAFKELSK